jgi:hypothetical protein
MHVSSLYTYCNICRVRRSLASCSQGRPLICTASATQTGQGTVSRESRQPDILCLRQADPLPGSPDYN